MKDHHVTCDDDLTKCKKCKVNPPIVMSLTKLDVTLVFPCDECTDKEKNED